MNNMNFLHHVIIHSLLPIAFFAVAATPVEVLGCRNRGLLALFIAFVSILAGLAAAVRAVLGRRRGEADAGRWMVSALILAIPPVALLFLA
ncbi:MAG TPA: hypothetical protein VIA07_08165 [Desulfuromonadales bacterium]|jgi:hypothetical protein